MIKHDFAAFARRIISANFKTALLANNGHYIFVPKSAIGEGFLSALLLAGVQSFKTPKGRKITLTYDNIMERVAIIIR